MATHEGGADGDDVVLPTGNTSKGGTPKPPTAGNNAGKKLVDGAHVVFDVETRMVTSLHAEDIDAYRAAQTDLLKPNPRIHGVVFVGWGESIADVIDAALLVAADRG